MARIRVIAGESSPYDTLKVKVDLAEVENELLELEKALEVARTEVMILMGRDTEGPIRIEGQLTFTPIAFGIDSLKQLALENHPALMAAEAGVRQSRSVRNLAWTDLLPSVHLRYFQMDIPEDANPDRWGGELGITIPLWILLRGQGAVRSTSLMVDVSRWHVIHEERQVLLDVKRAHSHLIVAGQQVENYRDNTLKEVEELVRIATRSYEEGEMGYLEMSDALKTLNRIRVGYSESIFEYLAALADLENTVGRPLS
jgi:cobalt-zinc-cadmium efflux system outer membrane protein